MTTFFITVVPRCCLKENDNTDNRDNFIILLLSKVVPRCRLKENDNIDNFFITVVPRCRLKENSRPEDSRRLLIVQILMISSFQREGGNNPEGVRKQGILTGLSFLRGCVRS